MDLRKNVEYVMNNKMGLDDTFQFRCKGCGKCCTHREDVLLTAYDLFRIARYFGRTPAEIVERYCETYIGDDSHFPIVKILPVPPNNACPFLRNKRCMVHQDKPVVCASFPLGRVYQPGEKHPFFVLQPGVNCGGEARTVTVRNWLGHLSSEESEIAGLLWSDSMLTICRSLADSWNQFADDKQKSIFQCLLSLLYLHYDIMEPFLPQFEDNALKAFLYIRTVVQLPDVPEWLPIHKIEKGEAQYDLLLRKAYGLYKQDWCGQHGLPVEMAFSNAKAPDGSMPNNLKLFESDIFSNVGCIKNLLCENHFALWKYYAEQKDKNNTSYSGGSGNLID